MTERILTVGDTLRLAEIVRAAQGKQKVARYIGHGMGTVEGTARAIVISAEQPAFADSTNDIRDCCLWVTTTGGFEVFWKISNLLDEVASGAFLADYEESTT